MKEETLAGLGGGRGTESNPCRIGTTIHNDATTVLENGKKFHGCSLGYITSSRLGRCKYTVLAVGSTSRAGIISNTHEDGDWIPAL